MPGSARTGRRSTHSSTSSGLRAACPRAASSGEASGRGQARLETYDLTTGIAMKFGGAFSSGIKYVKTMFGAHERQSHK